MNETTDLYLTPSDYSFLRSVSVLCTVMSELHPDVPLPPSRQPRTGERRHHRGCFLCQRGWRKRRQKQLELPMQMEPKPKRISRAPAVILSGLTLNDLVFLKDAGLAIDALDFTQVLEFENKHRDFSPWHKCGVTGAQHDLECPRASILTLPDWYERLKQIASDRFTSKDEICLRQGGVGL
jgi:hypothetical protein